MGKELEGKRIAVVLDNEGVEQVELTEPMNALRQAGAEVVLIAPKSGEIQAFNHLDRGDKFEADVSAADAKASDFDALVLPGGVANADNLRMDQNAIDLVQSFAEAGQPIGVICHGPWALIEADVVRGRTLTSWPTLQTDLRNAGAYWVDQEVVVCDEGPGTIVSSRKPDDLAAFCSAIIEQFASSPAREIVLH